MTNPIKTRSTGNLILSLACLLVLRLSVHATGDDSFVTNPSSDKKSVAPSVDFETEIMPIFSKFGCNAAECHGGATGRGDFKLSLFGGDPKRDYDAIVNQLAGRRVNLQAPQKSLLITKPTEVLAHGGGEVIDADSNAAKRFADWINAGATYGTGVSITGIQLNRKRYLVSKNSRQFRIEVAALTNGSKKNVTNDASFSSSNPTALKVFADGTVESVRPGKYFVIVKYLQFVSTVTVVHPFTFDVTGKLPDASHPIDNQIQISLRSLGLQKAKQTTEMALVRRLYLDLTGLLPTPEQARQYVNSNNENKKQILVDRLLASDEFHDYWSYWIRIVIQFRVPGNDKAAAKQLSRWVRTTVESDYSCTSTASQLVTATGDTATTPEANFHRFFQDARGQAETVANSFLGFRIGCANCHNHPLDRWTQEDYHGLAAIFATLKRGKTVGVLPDGNVIQPKTGKPAIPKLPGENNLKPGERLRENFAEWMVTSPRFTKAIVNRVWKHLMGRGIVEPVDDFRTSNPPIDAELLQLLALQFEKRDFRFKPLIRLIVTSKAYSSNSQNSPTANFWAGYRGKTVSPDVYYNICRQVLYPRSRHAEARTSYATNSLELHAEDSSLRLLKGCDPRGDCIAIGESEIEFGLREKLHLINGKFLNRWLIDPENDWRKNINSNDDLMNAVERLYWRCYSRPMNKSEKGFWKVQISSAPFAKSDKVDTAKNQEAARIRFLEDAIWSLINSQEFRNNQ